MCLLLMLYWIDLIGYGRKAVTLFTYNISSSDYNSNNDMSPKLNVKNENQLVVSPFDCKCHLFSVPGDNSNEIVLFGERFLQGGINSLSWLNITSNTISINKVKQEKFSKFSFFEYDTSINENMYCDFENFASIICDKYLLILGGTLSIYGLTGTKKNKNILLQFEKSDEIFIFDFERLCWYKSTTVKCIPHHIVMYSIYNTRLI